MRPGDFILVKEVVVDEGEVPTGTFGDTMQFTVTVINTGSGGIFDLGIKDILGTGFDPATLSIAVAASPAPPPGAQVDDDTYRFDYLSKGKSAVLVVDAVIDSCLNVDNTVNGSDRKGNTDTSLASVLYDLHIPQIIYDSLGGSSTATPATFSLENDSVTSITIKVANDGDVKASDVSINSSLESYSDLVITNVGNGWAYNPVNGTFSISEIAAATQKDITFDAEISGCPPDSRGGSISWFPSYVDFCGNVFKAPMAYSTWNVKNIPGIQLGKSVSDDRINMDENGFYTLDLTGSNIDYLPTDGDTDNDELTLTDTIPAGLKLVYVSAIPAGSVIKVNGVVDNGPTVNLVSGDVLTWHMDQEDFVITHGGSVSLRIDFTVDTFLQLEQCEPAQYIYNSASVAYDPAQCVLNDDAAISFLANESPVNSADQELNLFNSGNSPFETGLNDTNNTADDEIGEGEKITYVATHLLSGTGDWLNSTFTADLGTEDGLSTERVLNDGAGNQAITYEFRDNGGATVTGDVPFSSITSLTPQLVINLDFVNAFDTANGVHNDTLVIRYSTTITDTDLQGGDSRGFIERITLEIDGGVAGCLGSATYIKGVRVNILRAEPSITISHQNFLDVCEEFPVTLNFEDLVSDARSDNWRFEYDTSNYELITLPTDVTYTGHLNTLHGLTQLDESTAGTGLRVDFDPQTTRYDAAGGDSTAQFTVRLNPGYSSSNMAATLAYDDHQSTASLGGAELDRDFFANDTSTPVYVRQGDLEILITPQQIFAYTRDVTWTIYVINVGTGSIYNATIEQTIPNAFTPDGPNSSPAAAVAGQVMSWTLGDIAPGAKVPITVASNVNRSTCDLEAGVNTVVAKWGCGGVDVEVLSLDVGSIPTYLSPEHDSQITHVTANTNCDLCGFGTVDIEVLNSSLSHLYSVVLNENLMASGLTYVEDSTEISRDGGAFVPLGAAGNPSIAGSMLTWDENTIAELAHLDTIMDNEAGDGVYNRLVVRFGIKSPGEVFNSNARGIRASSEYEIACGDASSTGSPGSAFTIAINEPRISLNKTGWNVDAGQDESDASDVVYGGSADDVVWKIEVDNDGKTSSDDMFLRDYLEGNMILNDYCLVTPIDDYSACGVFTPFETLSSDEQIDIASIPSDETSVYYIRATVQNDCTNQVNISDVEWGCVGEGGRGGLTFPSKNSDDATLVVQPVIDGGVNIIQKITGLNGSEFPDTNGIITIKITNVGGSARNLVLTDTLPNGYEIDPTYIGSTSYATVSSVDTYVGNIDTVTTDISNPAVPIFTLSSSTGAAPQDNLLRYADVVTVVFRVVQVGNLDSTQDPEIFYESVGNNLDPTELADQNNRVQLDFTDTCGTASSDTHDQFFGPETPDLDISIMVPRARIVNQATDTELIKVYVRNNGDVTARNGVLTVTVGPGWSGSLPDGCTGSLPGDVTCELEPMAQNAGAIVNFNLTVDNEISELSFHAEVTGNILYQDDTDTDGNYSLDTIRAKILGLRMSKTLASCSEADSVDPDIWVGEDCTFLLNTSWFGGGLNEVTEIGVTDTVPNGEGYVSYADTGSDTIASETLDPSSPAQFGTNDTLLWNNFNGTNSINTDGTLAVFEKEIIIRASTARSIRMSLPITIIAAIPILPMSPVLSSTPPMMILSSASHFWLIGGRQLPSKLRCYR